MITALCRLPCKHATHAFVSDGFDASHYFLRHFMLLTDQHLTAILAADGRSPSARSNKRLHRLQQLHTCAQGRFSSPG